MEKREPFYATVGNVHWYNYYEVQYGSSFKTWTPETNATLQINYQFNSVTQPFRLFEMPWTAARLASLSITNYQSLLTLMSIELVMPSNHLILCCPLLLPPSIFPSMRVFSNESVLRIRWPKYWSFNFNISPSNEYSGLISLTISNQLYSSIKFKNFKCTISNDFNVFNNL